MRSLAFSVALLCATASYGAGASAETRAERPAEWTQFRLNPRHNPVLPGSLRVSWRVQTEGGFSSSPAIVGNAMYVGNNAGTMYALDVRDGKIYWTYHVREPLMSNPLVWHGSVFVGEGDQQYAFTNGGRRLFVGGTDNALISLDAQTGQLQWRLPLAGSGMPTGAIVDGVLVQHNGAGYIVGVDPAARTTRYIVNARSAAAMSAVLPLGDQDFVTAGGVDNSVQRRDSRTGALRWEARFPPGAWGMSDCPPATDGRFIFCNYNGAPPGVVERWHSTAPGVEHAWAIDASNGRIRWSTALELGRLPKTPRPSVGTNQAAIPLVTLGMVLFGSTVAPYVHALAAADGRVRWSLRVHGIVKSGLVEKDGVVYFCDRTGYVWAVDARSGTPIGWKNLHTRFNVGSPVIDGETLIVGSRTGALIAIPLDEIRSSHDQ